MQIYKNILHKIRSIINNVITLKRGYSLYVISIKRIDANTITQTVEENTAVVNPTRRLS